MQNSVVVVNVHKHRAQVISRTEIKILPYGARPDRELSDKIVEYLIDEDFLDKNVRIKVGITPPI